MNTTDYFTYINAMFLFCIFTCGLLAWAVIRGYVLKSNMNDDLTTAYDRIKQADMDIANETRKYDTLFKQHIERGKRIIALEVAKDNAEKESRDLRKQLDHSEADRVELRAERATLENKLTDALAKVRQRNSKGQFVKRKPSLSISLSGTEEVKTALNELNDVFDRIKAAQPKLTHGLTVKNPTEDEAKMIRDNAEILGIKKTDAFKSQAFPSLWYYVSENGEGEIVSCADNANPIKKLVTAQEFVQRMQNWRG